MDKKLFKSKTNRKLLGVCGGLGEFLGLDPTIIRLLWVISAMLGGVGLFVYLVAALIIPEDQ